MITLSQPSNSERAYVAEVPKPSDAVETAGSLAMLFENGLMTMGQYDEFVTNNPFVIDYSMYATFEGNDTIAMGGFLGDFSNAISSLGSFSDGGFADGFSGGFSSGSCSSCGGGFSSVC